MGIDEDAAAFFASPSWQPAHPVAGALYYLGHGAAWYLLAAALAVRRRWAVALPLGAALLATDATVYVLKEAVARPRPDAALFAGSDFAFPSGHTARAAAALGFAALTDEVARPARLAAATFLALQGLGRLVAQAHWLTDVLASVPLGLAFGAGAAVAWRRDALGVRSRVLAGLARAGIA